MITVDQVKSIINQELDAKGIFLVDLTVDKLNRIKVWIDNMEGVSIATCVDISRLIESRLDRDLEDYELEVSSPGIDRPFTMLFQYKKNIDRQVEVFTHEGISYQGLLIGADEKKLALEIKTKESVGNKKKKEILTKKIEIEFSAVKSAKVKITF